ncbi:MAG TPA: PAP/fibrillin family protein [Candidatus Caenarcaniphilales bacterium]|jgi:hypothetical protein
MLEKLRLLEAIAGNNRGLFASQTDKQAILAAAAQLEDHNPTPRPVEALDKLAGDWRLLYTTSTGLLGIDRLPLLKLGQIYQCIRVAHTKVYNLAEIYGLPFLEGLVGVAAQFEPVSERRVQVQFERAIVGLQRFIDYQSPGSFVAQIEAGQKFPALNWQLNRQEQQGWLDITYLDDDLRIGRGNEGSLFILSKV